MPNSDPDLQAFFSQKPADVKRWFTAEFYHPALGTLRYVNDYTAKNLQIEAGAPRNAGETVEFLPIGIEWQVPDQANGGAISLPIVFSEVGTDMREKLKSLSPWAVFDGIDVILRLYLSNVADPRKFYYLQVTNISLSGSNAQISASDENASTKRTARAYTFNDFPGLSEL